MKAHLLDSDIPILEGSTVTANCGEEVPNAMAPVRWDMDTLGRMKSPHLSDEYMDLIGICRKCTKKLWGTKLYLYGIANGQELKHGEG